MREFLLRKAADAPIFFDSFSQIFGLLLKRIAAEELENFRNLGEGGPHFILFPKIYRDV